MTLVTDYNGTGQQFLHTIANIFAKGLNFIGIVGGSGKVYPATAFVCDTAIYASGDVLTDTLELDNALRIVDGTGLLSTLTLIDKDDQGVPMDVYILTANVSLGSKNSPPNISDVNSEGVLAVVPITASDWKDLGGSRVAYLKNLGIIIQGGTGTKKIWISVVNGTGTPTFTASGLMVRPGILQN